MRTGAVSARLAIGVVGTAIGAWGAWLLLETGWANVLAAVTWLAGGVVAHDALLAPATIAVTWLAVRVLPATARPAAAAAAVVIGTITVVAIPLLGRPGAEADNPSLLPRDYVLGWTVIVLVVLVVAAAGAAAQHVRYARRSDDVRLGSDGDAD